MLNLTYCVDTNHCALKIWIKIPLLAFLGYENYDEQNETTIMGLALKVLSRSLPASKIFVVQGPTFYATIRILVIEKLRIAFIWVLSFLSCILYPIQGQYSGEILAKRILVVGAQNMVSISFLNKNWYVVF